MSKRILVVEDQEDSRRILRDLLSSADYEMTEAVNGEQALAAVAKQRPDLILMDIQMPVLDGYEATRRIKADPALKNVPIIVVTSYASRAAAMRPRRARRAAMTSYPNLSARVSCWRKSGNCCRSYRSGVPAQRTSCGLLNRVEIDHIRHASDRFNSFLNDWL
jgi:two-component system, cell cycle response regulator DivK